MLKNIALFPGYLEITDDGGQKRQIMIADVLRAADLPTFTISNLTLLTKLASLVWIITMTLVEQGILSESLIEGYDIPFVRETLVDELAVVEGEV